MFHHQHDKLSIGRGSWRLLACVYHSLSFLCLLYSFDRHALELLEKMLTLDPSQVHTFRGYCPPS